MTDKIIPIMIIMRGLPGSGKSTQAKLYANQYNAVICSADDYFMTDDGRYLYDADEIRAAHAVCKLKARVALAKGENVIIDNTNIKLRDMQEYFDMAKNYGAHVHIAHSPTEWAMDVEECAKRNVHGVPKEVIQRMKDNWYQMQGNEFENKV